MLDKLTRGIGGLRRGHGHFQASAGFGFEEHKEFSSRVESSGGFVDRQARYNHRTGNHGRPPMHVWDEEDSDSDVEEFFESSRTQHTTALPQPLHMNFRPPPPVTQPHHNGKMGKIGNGLQQGHEIHGMKHQGGHEMQHQGMHGMQHQGGHRIQHQGMHGMQHPGGVVVNATENWRVSKITGQKLGWGGKGL
ncbi:unknown protein; 93447-94797 [Arabidopsis thaliana]|uniref:Uncharacterized protein T23K23.28 n=1 Tax=Arabidopsis thaliana TaxID=3702 RepID=Q9C9V3_ARATH|nr:unknown protein; 93447-94797 [Arabidopsis thaliana]